MNKTLIVAALSALASGQAAAASDVSAQPAAAYGKIAKTPNSPGLTGRRCPWGFYLGRS